MQEAALVLAVAGRWCNLKRQTQAQEHDFDRSSWHNAAVYSMASAINSLAAFYLFKLAAGVLAAFVWIGPWGVLTFWIPLIIGICLFLQLVLSGTSTLAVRCQALKP
jgi:Flp pilus assembly protein TadB